MRNDYSEKEFQMISELSPTWAKVITEDRDSSVMPPKVLDLVALECFVKRKEGKAVDSLRRCVNALHTCKPYRMTPAYEALIEL